MLKIFKQKIANLLDWITKISAVFFVGLSFVFSPVSFSLEPPLIGNYALPTSQQPGPFLGFGQNIIDKNQLQIYTYPNFLKDTTDHYLQIPMAFLYGLSDQASVLVTVPYAARYTDGMDRSSGISDSSIQGEYAFYEKSNAKYFDQATIVGALSLPTGSFYKSPPTGYGSPAYFIGSTFSRMYTDWYWFVSPGALWVSQKENVKEGGQYLYQLGLGRTLISKKDTYIFAALVEMDGLYTERTRVSGVSDPNTGGNIIYISPSLWLSNNKLFVQLGISLPVAQHWYGMQSSTKYYASFAVGWTFT